MLSQVKLRSHVHFSCKHSKSSFILHSCSVALRSQSMHEPVKCDKWSFQNINLFTLNDFQLLLNLYLYDQLVSWLKKMDVFMQLVEGLYVNWMSRGAKRLYNVT